MANCILIPIFKLRNRIDANQWSFVFFGNNIRLCNDVLEFHRECCFLLVVFEWYFESFYIYPNATPSQMFDYTIIGML